MGKAASRDQRADTNQRRGRVQTPDGVGTVLGAVMRHGTNGGPGTRQWRVRLDDGRIRHYKPSDLTERAMQMVAEVRRG